MAGFQWPSLEMRRSWAASDLTCFACFGGGASLEINSSGLFPCLCNLEFSFLQEMCSPSIVEPRIWLALVHLESQGIENGLAVRMALSKSNLCNGKSMGKWRRPRNVDGLNLTTSMPKEYCGCEFEVESLRRTDWAAGVPVTQ